MTIYITHNVCSNNCHSLSWFVGVLFSCRYFLFLPCITHLSLIQLEFSLEYLKTTLKLSPVKFLPLYPFSRWITLPPITLQVSCKEPLKNPHLTSRSTFLSPLHFSWLLPGHIKELHKWDSSQFFLWTHKLPFLICNHFISPLPVPSVSPPTPPLCPPQIKIPFTPVSSHRTLHPS